MNPLEPVLTLLLPQHCLNRATTGGDGHNSSKVLISPEGGRVLGEYLGSQITENFREGQENLSITALIPSDEDLEQKAKEDPVPTYTVTGKNQRPLVTIDNNGLNGYLATALLRSIHKLIKTGSDLPEPLSNFIDGLISKLKPNFTKQQLLDELSKK